MKELFYPLFCCHWNCCYCLTVRNVLTFNILVFAIAYCQQISSSIPKKFRSQECLLQLLSFFFSYFLKMDKELDQIFKKLFDLMFYHLFLFHYRQMDNNLSTWFIKFRLILKVRIIIYFLFEILFIQFGICLNNRIDILWI